MPPEMPLSPLWGSPSAQQSRVPGKDAGISRLCRGPKVPATPVAVCCQPSPSLPMWARLLSSLHPSQPSFFLGHSLSGKRGYAGGQAWVPLPPGARDTPCGLAVAASLLYLLPQAKPQCPSLWMHQLLQDSQQLWAQILSHPGFKSQLCHLLAVRFEISHLPFLCLLSLSVEWRPEHLLPRTQRHSYCSS